MAIRIDYDRNPRTTVEQKLESLKESTQRALEAMEGVGNTVIGGQTIIVKPSGSGTSSDKTFVYTQNTPSDEWTVKHDLDKYPAVTVVDSANSVVVGECQYIDKNTVVLRFKGAFSGKAYCN